MNPCFFQDMYILKINSLVKKNEFRKKLQLQPYCAEPTTCHVLGGYISHISVGMFYKSHEGQRVIRVIKISQKKTTALSKPHSLLFNPERYAGG